MWVCTKRQGRNPVSVLLQKIVRYWTSSKQILFSGLMAIFFNAVAKPLQANAGNRVKTPYPPETLARCLGKSRQHQTPLVSTGLGEYARSSSKLSGRNTNLCFMHVAQQPSLARNSPLNLTLNIYCYWI